MRIWLTSIPSKYPYMPKYGVAVIRKAILRTKPITVFRKVIELFDNPFMMLASVVETYTKGQIIERRESNFPERGL